MPKPKQELETVSAAIPRTKSRELDRIAASEQRTKSWVIRTAIESYLARRRRKAA